MKKTSSQHQNDINSLFAWQQAILDSSEYGIISTDTKGLIATFNRTSEILLGYKAEEMIGIQTPAIIHDPDEVEEYAELLSKELGKKIEPGFETFVAKTRLGEVDNREWRYVRKDGSIFPVYLSVTAIRNTEQEIIGFLGTFFDLSERKKAEKKLSYLANHDSLTGLINRREFEHRVERLLSTIHQDKSEHALCFMDLDQFKIINDTCGHIAGDELLRQLAQVLQGVVRHRDTLARLGGDEFGVLMEHCSLEQAQRVANVIRQGIEDYQFSWEGQSFRVGLSIGIVAINEITPNLTELLKQADAACYMAKDLGRNRIHTYYPEDNELAQRLGQMQWVTDINQALEEDRFCLYAQPIIPLDDSAHRHYEMLLRMIDGKGNVIVPDAFMPAAERYGLMGMVDRWVIEKALALLAENPTFLEEIEFVSINLSGESLSSSGFLDFIIVQLKNSGTDASKICFEITETLAISNLSTATTFISTLKKLGCYFALDDFGSGLSSFGYLKSLPVDYLKIDGMFVKDIVDDAIDHAMVKSINDIAQLMGMKTIAEYVETDEIKGMLREIGVNYAQGFGVGEPQAFEELIDLSVFKAIAPE
jgi:diguanylate cyclase (GGDEF)-like protein